MKFKHNVLYAALFSVPTFAIAETSTLAEVNVNATA